MNYYPLYGVRSWNNGVHCMWFYILIITLDSPVEKKYKMFIVGLNYHLSSFLVAEVLYVT